MPGPPTAQAASSEMRFNETLEFILSDQFVPCAGEL